MSTPTGVAPAVAGAARLMTGAPGVAIFSNKQASIWYFVLLSAPMMPWA